MCSNIVNPFCQFVAIHARSKNAKYQELKWLEVCWKYTFCRNPTMHLHHIPQWTILNRNVYMCAHIPVTKWCIVEYETGALWDLWDGTIVQIITTRTAPSSFLICGFILSSVIIIYMPTLSFSCDQAALRTPLSVRLSDRPSVCLSVTPFFYYVPVIVSSRNFRSYYQQQKLCPCKRSRSKVKGQCHKGHEQT